MQSNSHKRFSIVHRAGFSLADLLISLCAVLILVALALPLLVKSREQASKTKCANNMRQIIIAGHNFHDAYKRLPPGTLGFQDAIKKDEWKKDGGEYNWQRTQHTSSLGMVMPFMELNNVYDLIDPAQFNLYKYIDEIVDSGRLKADWFGDITGVPNTSTKQMKPFTCPADNLAKAQLDKVVIAIQPVILDRIDSDDYAVIFDTDVKDKWDLKNRPVATTNYLGCAGVHSGGRHPQPERRVFSGIMTSRNRMTLETVRDGTSNTIAYGETLGQIKKGRRTQAQAWFTAGLARGRADFGFDQEIDVSKTALIGNSKNASLFGFASAHDEGANFAFGDGSVRSFKRDIDRDVFFAFCGANDGEFYRREDTKKYESPIVDFEVRPILREHQSEMRDLNRAMMELKVEKARRVNIVIEKLKKVAEVQGKKKNQPEVDRAYREILKLNPDDKDARKYYQDKGTLDALLEELKEQGYPKEPFMKVPTRPMYRDRVDRKREAYPKSATPRAEKKQFKKSEGAIKKID